MFDTATRVLEVGLENRMPGEPVVVLQSGAGTALEGWGDWPARLAEFAPIVGFDRPGLGESEFDGVDPTPSHVAGFTREMLNVLDVAPPYVLVGHSWGGPLILYFAASHPSEVVGMVYIDPQDPLVSRSELMLTDDPVELERRATAYAEAVAASRGDEPLPAGRAAEGRARAAFSRPDPGQRGVPTDPDVPTAVVLTTRTPDMTGAPYYINEEWFREYHRVRVGRYTNWSLGRADTRILISTDAGHFVHLDQPDLATSAVKHVLDRVSGKSGGPQR